MKFLFSLIFISVTLGAADLGVLYNNTTTNNPVSPNTLSINNLGINTNINLRGKTPARALVLDSGTNITTAAMTQTQADQLGSIVGGLQRLVLGSAEIISGSGTPTNGTAYVQRILYINTSGTNLNDTYWGNYGTNWYAIASTNGGSITENQFNFSDNTTANATTNMHGLLPKLGGTASVFLNGLGLWSTVSSGLNFSPYAGSPYRIALIDESDVTHTFNYDATFSYNSGTLSVDNLSTETGLFSLGVITPFISGLADDTTGDVSITTHGLVPKAPNDSSKFLNGLGQWAIPAGGGGGTVGITGSPGATYVTYWSGTNTITGNAGFTFNGTTVALNGTLNAGAITANSMTIPSGAPTGNFTYGSFVPSFLGSGAGSGTTQYSSRYHRIGNIVTCSGYVQLNCGASPVGAFTFNMQLPITSSISATHEVSGVGSWLWNGGAIGTSTPNITILGNTGLESAQFQVIFPRAGVQTYSFQFTYTVN